MQPAPANPFTRSDTLTGTCQAIGEDFGFPPNILRIAFALALFWSAGWTFAAYFALGAAVLVSRLAFPSRAAPVQPAETAPVIRGDNDLEPVSEARAA